MIIRIKSSVFGSILRAAQKQFETDAQTARDAGKGFEVLVADFTTNGKICGKLIEETDSWSAPPLLVDHIQRLNLRELSLDDILDVGEVVAKESG